MLAGGAVVSVRFICCRCHNAYRAGQMFGPVCPRCEAETAAVAKQEETKTALADDLVRGVPPNSRDSDT